MGKEVLINIGVIGMGNCGGQMAQAATERGFDAVAINASMKDLELLGISVVKFGVGDGRGTGKDRNDAREFMIEKINVLQDDAMVAFLENHDAIAIATSIGGGFGSGSSLIAYNALCEMYPDKLFIPAGVFPFADEAYTAHNHAIGWLQELEETEATYLLYDNNRFSTIPKADACKRVNEQFAEDLCVLRGDYINTTLTGGIDNRDMLTAISVAGRVVVDTMELDESDIINGSLPETIAAHIKNDSAHAEMVDDKEIRVSALMYTLRKNFAPYTIGVKAAMQEVFGDHINDYDNFADVVDDFDDPDSISVILSGLTLPTMRINRLIATRDKMEKSITTRTQSTSKLGSAGTGNSALNLKAKSFAAKAEPAKKAPDRAAILSKYAKASASHKPSVENKPDQSNKPVE